MAQLLLVEDDAAIRSALIRTLTERGHAVTSTPAAMTALQHLLASPPDLILLDLGLPDVSGYEALRMMRAVSSVPVVVVTACDDEADIIRVLDAGADDYVVKPFGPGQIEARIRAVLRRRHPAIQARRPARRSAACGWTRTGMRPPWTARRSTSAAASSTSCIIWRCGPDRW